MFNFGALAANVLNSLDNVAKDTLEEPRISATAIRSKRQNTAEIDTDDFHHSDDEDEQDHEEVIHEPLRYTYDVRIFLLFMLIEIVVKCYFSI